MRALWLNRTVEAAFVQREVCLCAFVAKSAIKSSHSDQMCLAQIQDNPREFHLDSSKAHWQPLKDKTNQHIRDLRCSPSKILRSIYFHLRLIIVKDVSTVAITIFLFKLVVHLHYTHMRHLMHYAIHTYIHQVQISQQDFTRITHLLGTVSLLARVLPSFHESASVGGQYIGGPGYSHEKS